LRRNELDGQLRQSSTLAVQRQEVEQDLTQKLNRAHTEKAAMSERVASLQRALNGMETEKREVERNANRLDKDKSALRKTLDKVEREKLKTEEIATKTVHQRGELDHAFRRLEEENIDLVRQIQNLQAHLAQVEQTHSSRLLDITTRHRAETEMEVDRLRSVALQAERTLEARERAHRQRVKGLEEQVSTLKDQMGQEVRKRQQFISKSSRSGADIADIRSILDTSLTNVSRDPNLDMDNRRAKEDLAPARLTPRHRSPARSPLLRAGTAGGGGSNRSGTSFRMRSPVSMKKPVFKQ